LTRGVIPEQAFDRQIAAGSGPEPVLRQEMLILDSGFHLAVECY
jgi:hypothetical protein